MMTLALPLTLLIGAFAGPSLRSDGGVALPQLSSDVDVTITGDIATVHVTQVFTNPNDAPLHALYLFPLPHDSAVHAMTMEVGGRLVQAKIKRVEEAKAEFEAAKSEGKTASLLEEHRANVFTQDVANIPPGDRVTISISYAQTVPREDGAYVFHFPMAVGDRYQNGANGVSVQALDKPLPTGITTGEGAKGQRSPRVSIRMDLRAGLPISALESPSHAIEVDVLGASRRKVALAEGKVVDDRDFILKYRLSGSDTAAALITHRDARGEFFTALIEPPSDVAPEEITPRELVFVLDASGSMGGAPIAMSRRLVDRMLDVARPNDTFRVIQFGSDTAAFSADALPATRDNIARAKQYVAAIDGMGGTEIELGIKAALDPALPDGRLRMVVFLTDGYIGDEASVMATIQQHRKDHTTIFSFGVGDAVNRWLLEEMAVAGRGVARIVGVDEDAAAVVDALAERLRSPILTNLSIDWGDAKVELITPKPLPDLYAGAPLRVLGRFAAGKKPAQVTLTGWRKGKPAKISIPIEASAEKGTAATEAIPILWARSQIADRMRAMTRPAHLRGSHDAGDNALVEQITRLGLDYAITTRWTAFVAVSDVVVDQTKEAISAQVPTPSTFSSAPEPAEWAMMLMLAAVAVVMLRRRARI